MSICSVKRSTGLRAALALAVLFPLMGGCDGIRPIPEDVSRFDRPGVSIVVNHERASVGAGGQLAERKPETTIGAIDGPFGQLLHGVVDIDLSADGVLVVQETNVRLYDERGTLDRSFGREGRRPGEFTRISSAVSCGDDLFATEASCAREFRPRAWIPRRRGWTRFSPFPAESCSTDSTSRSPPVTGRSGSGGTVRSAAKAAAAGMWSARTAGGSPRSKCPTTFHRGSSRGRGSWASPWTHSAWSASSSIGSNPSRVYRSGDRAKARRVGEG